MSEPYRVAIIGSTGRGNYGHDLDQAWLDFPEAKIVAIADEDEKGRADAAARLSTSVTYADYQKMLRDQEPEIVCICPRWVDRRREMSLAAAQSGAHIYMEKPLCPTLSDADAIVAACEKAHVKLAVAHPTRYSPRLATVRKMIQKGMIGQVLEYRGRGKEDRRGGGEDLWVLGTHIMDMIRAVAGHPTWCFARVTQKGRPITAKDVVAGNEGLGLLAGDAVFATYGMPGGAVATFGSVRNMSGQPSRYALQIYGSKGVLEIREGLFPPVKFLEDSSWSPGRSKKLWQSVTTGGIEKPELDQDPNHRKRHYLAIKDFLNAINNDRQPDSSMYEARGATEMIVSVFESARQNGPVSLPLKNRENPLAQLK